MSRPTAKNPLKHLRGSDLRGIVQLATQATAGASRVVEGVHQSVWSALGAPGGSAAGTTRGITGLVYKSVRGVNRLVGTSVETVLSMLAPLLDGSQAKPGSIEREAVLAALNGVLGDQLAASGNPLATRMQFFLDGQVLNASTIAALKDNAASGKILLLVHGLCMNDLQWRTVRQGQHGTSPAEVFDHGLALAQSLGYTPVYLRYNSGLHVSDNGHALAALLNELVAIWPQPVQELSILAHSMGGLVARSACHCAVRAAAQNAARNTTRAPGAWLGHLKNFVFLGTPHHGAPMERAGNWVDVVLGSTPYSAPFAKIGQLRSAGITDLRYGLVQEIDWQGRDRFQRTPDRRHPLPLPQGVACYAVAATTAAKRSAAAERLIGDGLVPLRSALGQHDKPEHCLAFSNHAQAIVYRVNHWDLLKAPVVAAQVQRWLANGRG